MIYVGIENPDDGELGHLVGPFVDDDAADAWLDQWATAHGWDRDFIYVVKPTAPDDPGLAEFYA